MAEKEILLLLRKAVELAGDGGQQPFTEDEYDEMYYYVELYTKEIYMKLKRMNKAEICLSTERHENLVDACVEMILKLNEQNLL